MIEELIRRTAAEDDDAIEELCEIADADPRRLAPYQGLAPCAAGRRNRRPVRTNCTSVR
ncbi:hypothetical protein [Micromonospora sp. NPDC000668]|uniref:hypothetical protein n=1 Tax=Micromonospora sp. NPDC000668 TaxID=3364219 RepID=UPI0036A26E53